MSQNRRAITVKKIEALFMCSSFGSLPVDGNVEVKGQEDVAA